MGQKPIDAFSKEFLSEFLSPFGRVKRSFEVPGESKYIDLLFLPTDDIQPKEREISLPPLTSIAGSTINPANK